MTAERAAVASLGPANQRPQMAPLVAYLPQLLFPFPLKCDETPWETSSNFNHQTNGIWQAEEPTCRCLLAEGLQLLTSLLRITVFDVSTMTGGRKSPPGAVPDSESPPKSSLKRGSSGQDESPNFTERQKRPRNISTAWYVVSFCK